MRTCYLTIFILLTIIAKGQNITNLTLDDFYREFKATRFNSNRDQNTGIVGSPYEKEDFIPGEVVTVSRLRYSGIPLQMNLYTNNLEFRNEDGSTLYIGIPEIVDYAVIDKEKIIYAPYSVGSRILKSYFTVLSEGKVLLLQKKRVILKPAEQAQAYKEAVPARFERAADEFYLRFPPSEARRLANKKDLAEILGKYPPELDSFIKKNKIRYYKAEEVKKLIDYYNTLVSGE